MKNLLKATILTLLLVLLSTNALVFAEVNSVTPSTNDENREKGWAHVNVLDVGIGEITLEFVQPRSFFACFEYRTDGDTSQKISDNNFNSLITDGLYPYICLNADTQTETFTANEYIEVRMVFGAESDERFDWTHFDVETPPVPEEKDQCKKYGWMEFYREDGTPFKNQGQCIQYVLTGK
jgi:hypothetical protein